jgi:putative membrane protein
VAIWAVVWTKALRIIWDEKATEQLPIPGQPKKPEPKRFDPILLNMLGFLVGIAISFRNSTAYERYNDGRKYWAQLQMVSTNLARIIWVHCKEREGERVDDLLAKT